MSQDLFPLQFLHLLISAKKEKEHYPRPLERNHVALQKTSTEQEMAFDTAKSEKWEKYRNQRRKILTIS